MATATMNISLPEALRDFVEEQVEEHGYTSVSEYMRELVRQAKADRDLEARLLASLDSGDPAQVGPEYFKALKQKARLAAAKKRPR